MQKYAIIRIKGKQYRVSEGQDILVDKADPDSLIPEVLLISDGGKVTIGKPVLKDSKVKIKIFTEVEKGEKIDVLKYKSKSRYRKHWGFRPKYTRLQIEKII